MSLDSNAQLDRQGKPLPHFTPFALPCSNGINLFSQDLSSPEFQLINPYVFPPFNLIGPVLRLLCGFEKNFTIVVPEVLPHAYWWPGLVARSSASVRLGFRGDRGVILKPSKTGFKPSPCPFDMWAFRVSRF